MITVVATGFDSDYYKAIDKQREEEAAAARVVEEAKAVEEIITPEGNVAVEEEKKPTMAQEDFVAKEDNKKNMWDSIRSEEVEEDLDVPPTLRAKLRRKK